MISNTTFDLPIGGSSFSLQRLFLNPANPLSWYGFDTTSVVVVTEATVILGPVAAGPLRFNIATAVTAGIPLGFGRQGFLPSASNSPRIIAANDGVKITISWENIPFNVNGGSGLMITQVILYLDGDIEIRRGEAKLPDFDNGEQLGFFQSIIRDNTFYVQDETVTTGAPIGGGGNWEAGDWPSNQCRFFSLERRE
jgi:hypothetical protein